MSSPGGFPLVLGRGSTTSPRRSRRPSRPLPGAGDFVFFFAGDVCSFFCFFLGFLILFLVFFVFLVIFLSF